MTAPYIILELRLMHSKIVDKTLAFETPYLLL